MLTVFTALTALTVLTSPAVAQDEAPTKVVKVPDLPLEVTLPDPETGPPPWVNIAQVENDMLLSVDHNEDNSTIWFGYTEGLQPDLSKAQPDGLTEGQLEVLSFLGFTPPAEVQASATEHATFGLTWVSLGTTTLDDPNLEEPVTYELHGVVIPAESGFVQVLGLSATPGAIAGHVETLLGWTTLKRPPVAADKLVTGKLEHPSGYTIDIPPSRPPTRCSTSSARRRSSPRCWYTGWSKTGCCVSTTPSPSTSRSSADTARAASRSSTC